jgi:hypothetical protein
MLLAVERDAMNARLEGRLGLRNAAAELDERPPARDGGDPESLRGQPLRNLGYICRAQAELVGELLRRKPLVIEAGFCWSMSNCVSAAFCASVMAKRSDIESSVAVASAAPRSLALLARGDTEPESGTALVPTDAIRLGTAAWLTGTKPHKAMANASHGDRTRNIGALNQPPILLAQKNTGVTEMFRFLT